jgi:hypothetical protein
MQAPLEIEISNGARVKKMPQQVVAAMRKKDVRAFNERRSRFGAACAGT